VATGGFQGNVLFASSGSALQSQGASDVFAVRYAANGDHVWSFRYGDAGSDVGTQIAATPDGSVVFTGAFNSASITFGGFDLTGTNDVFVTRMSPGDTPTHEWAVALGGDDTDRAEGLAVDPDGYVYVLAYFMGMTNVDGVAMTAANYDAWLGALIR
jgi:secreted PhoX family phosphatase